MTFAIRRLRNALVTLFPAVLVVLGLWTYSLRLRDSHFISGWLLLATVLLLTMYNARKKIPYFPLADSASWLQLHIYAGLFTIVLFAMHACWRYDGSMRLPRGPFQLILAWLYMLTAASGILGLIISRTFPGRLKVRGEEVIFERIPIFLLRIREQAQALMLQAAAETNAGTLADFYTARLIRFFAGPRNFWLHLIQSRRPRHVIQTEIRTLQRYLNDCEKQIAEELWHLIDKKDDIDHAYAVQLALKGWLFGHIALTYSLLTFVAAHVVVAYAFYGGVQ